MKKIICIGECGLDIIFESGSPVGSMPGGREINAAAILARNGLPVTMASETSDDAMGDIPVKFLDEAGVDTGAIDRFIGGHTPITILTPNADGTYSSTRYEEYGDGGFDIVWPRVDDHTVVLYGGYYTLDQRMRQRMAPYLAHCKEVNAAMIYVPGFPPNQQQRITRIMPALLENLELADVVISRSDDLKLIFNSDDDSQCYIDHISFYCQAFANIDVKAGKINIFAGRNKSADLDITSPLADTLLWTAGAIAGIVANIYNNGVANEAIEAHFANNGNDVVSSAITYADKATEGLSNDWRCRIK